MPIAWAKQGSPFHALGGAIWVARLDALGLGAEFITLDEHRPTGTVSVRLDAAGVPDFTIYTDVAWDALTGTPEILALAPRVDAVCFGSLAQRSLVTRRTVQPFLRACPGDAFTTVLAVGMLPMLVYKANTKWRPFQAVSQHPCVLQYGGVGHRCYSFGV